MPNNTSARDNSPPAVILQFHYDWFETIVRSGCPSHRSIKPVILRLSHHINGVVKRTLARFIYLLAATSTNLEGAS